MSRPHQIDLDHMLAFVESEAHEWRIYASDGDRFLYYRFAGGYRVRAGSGKERETIYEGTDGRSAVNAYNAVI